MNLLQALSVFAVMITALCSAFGQPFVDAIYKVKSTNDVVYGTAPRHNGASDTLRMNIVVPTNDNAVKRPLIVWIHGGGFIQGSRSDFQSLAEIWAKRGYTAVTISYRLGIHGGVFDPPFAYDEAELVRACFRGIQDVRTGLRFLAKNAQQYGIDTSRIVIGGASAGSIIALHAAYIDQQDMLPEAIGEISDVTRAGGTFKRPDMGSYDGVLYPDVTTPTVDVVLNIFGALLNRSYLDNSAFVPLFSYHQTEDPVVACGVDRPYHTIPLVSANYPRMIGTCAIVEELEKRGTPMSQYEAIIHQGAAHEVHDPAGIDKAAAVFAAKYISIPTSVAESDEVAFDPGSRWTLHSLNGEVVACNVTASEITTLPDGVYAAHEGGLRCIIVLTNGCLNWAR
jgi:acetyl esterase/lipase